MTSSRPARSTPPASRVRGRPRRQPPASDAVRVLPKATQPIVHVPKIKVMLSSRNRDLIPAGAGAVALSDVRQGLQEALQGERFCGHQLLEVWINEGAGADDGSADAWEQCLRQVDEADIVVVIYNGHGGWTQHAGDIGICHVEMQRAYAYFPSKLRLITLQFASASHLGLQSPAEVAQETPVNRRFAEFIQTANLFAGQAKDRDSLEAEVRLAIVKATSELVGQQGHQEGRRGRYHLGSPLDWSRLSYGERKAALETVMREYLVKSWQAADDGAGLVVPLAAARVLWRVHGVPSAFGVAEARDLVGRPHIEDHQTAVTRPTGDLLGPVHIIACHKSVTESQIITFMGQPDLYLVQGPFGFFVADQTVFVQTFFLTQCRDATSTTLALQRMFDWIGQSGERERLVARARARGAILRTIAAEIRRTTGGNEGPR